MNPIEFIREEIRRRKREVQRLENEIAKLEAVLHDLELAEFLKIKISEEAEKDG